VGQDAATPGGDRRGGGIVEDAGTLKISQLPKRFQGRAGTAQALRRLRQQRQVERICRTPRWSSSCSMNSIAITTSEKTSIAD